MNTNRFRQLHKGNYSFCNTVINAVLSSVATLLLPIPLKLLYGLKVKGRHHLRKIKKTGAITVSNHCQYMEPVFTGLSLWPRRIWYMVEENNILRKDVGWLNRRLGAVGIPRKNPASIESHIGEVLNRNHIVHFYPEGVLTFRNQKIKTFHKGAFYFSLKFNVPVIPMTEVLHERRRGKVSKYLPPRVTFIIGKPIFPIQINGKTASIGVRAKYFSGQVHTLMQNTIDENGGNKELFSPTPTLQE